MQPTIEIGAVLRKSFDLYKENITTLLLATLLVGIISAVTLGILAGPMMAGLAMVTLALIDRQQPKPDIGAIFGGFSFFVPTLVFVILLFVASLVGQLLVIIPAIGTILSVLYSLALDTFVMFTVLNIVDRKMDVVPAIQASVDTVKANFWIFLGLNIVASVIGGIGIVACVVGVIVTAPMYFTMIAMVYRDLHPAAAPSAPVA